MRYVMLRLTFKFTKLIVSIEADSVVDVVGLERNPEKVSVGYDKSTSGHHMTSAQWRHLAVDQVDVEVGENNVVTLCLL